MAGVSARDGKPSMAKPTKTGWCAALRAANTDRTKVQLEAITVFSDFFVTQPAGAGSS